MAPNKKAYKPPNVATKSPKKDLSIESLMNKVCEMKLLVISYESEVNLV
jgi:hypothetical protein